VDATANERGEGPGGGKVILVILCVLKDSVFLVAKGRSGAGRFAATVSCLIRPSLPLGYFIFVCSVGSLCNGNNERR
jgi:hypothetical protein